MRSPTLGLLGTPGLVGYQSLLPDFGLALQGEAAQCQVTLLGRVSRKEVLGSEDAPTSLGQGNITKS